MYHLPVYSVSGMVLWGPGSFSRPFPCHPPCTREVGVPIRRLKILAKFALPPVSAPHPVKDATLWAFLAASWKVKSCVCVQPLCRFVVRSGYFTRIAIAPNPMPYPAYGLRPHAVVSGVRGCVGECARGEGGGAEFFSPPPVAECFSKTFRHKGGGGRGGGGQTPHRNYAQFHCKAKFACGLFYTYSSGAMESGQPYTRTADDWRTAMATAAPTAGGRTHQQRRSRRTRQLPPPPPQHTTRRHKAQLAQGAGSTGNVTHRERERERVVCQVRRDALHRGAGACCAPGARWARFLLGSTRRVVVA